MQINSYMINDRTDVGWRRLALVRDDRIVDGQFLTTLRRNQEVVTVRRKGTESLTLWNCGRPAESTQLGHVDSHRCTDVR
jgi:hypothetical protein